MTINWKIYLAALALAVGVSGFSEGASAATKAKKMTLEQAWKVCKERVDKEYGKSSTEGTAMNARYLV